MSKWIACTVQDLVDQRQAEVKTGPFGTQLHASDYVKDGIPVINVRNIGLGDIRPEKLEFISEKTAQRLSSHLLKPNDIVFGRKGAVERHAFIRKAHDRWFQGSDCLRLRISGETVDPRFVSYCCLTEAHKSWMMNQCSHGATMASLNQDIVKRIPLTLPPLETQHKIASILSAYDDLIENNTRRIKILEEMAQSLYRERFVNFRFPGHDEVKMVDSLLGMVPEGWAVATVGQIIRRVSAGKKYENKTVSPTGEVPVLDQGKSGVIGYHNDEAGIIASELNPIIVFANHTCYQRLIHFPFSAIQNVLPFLPARENQRSIYWLHWATKDLIQFNDYKGHWPEFIGKELLLPDTKTANIFEKYVRSIVQLIWKLEVKNQNLRQTRDLLLPKLISGEINVQGVD